MNFEDWCNLITRVLIMICVYVIPALIVWGFLSNLFNWLT